MSMPRLCTVSSLGLVIVVLASGCDGRSRKASARLRVEVHQLKEELELSRHQVSELEAKVAEAAVESGGNSVTLLNVPRVAAIELSRLSSVRSASEGSATLDLHVTAVDGRGRPIQLTGRLKAVARFMPVDKESIELGRVSLSPAEVRDAWRAGVLGASYQVEIPLQLSLISEDSSGIHVSARFTDALTGVDHDATVEVRVPSQPEE
ncbi:MAG: hypothetical protein VX908_00545 [Planctomycetota bacterium]|nr:hypothetical protein [Planctomycetota bacterium]